MPRLSKWWIGFEIVLLASVQQFNSRAFCQELSSQPFDQDFDALIRTAQKYVVSVVAQSDTSIPAVGEQDSAASAENSLMVVDKKVCSGFIVDSQGIVVTRRSVIEGMKSVSVIMQNGEAHNAEVIGVDSQFNIALLKVKVLILANPLFAHDTATQIGDWVLVIGYPLGFSPAVSLATVTSAFEQGIIKISTTIGPGSIGAPVFNLRGQVVGILAARMASDHFEQFPQSLRENEAVVIPMGLLLPRINQMIKESATEIGWVGMSVTAYPSNENSPVFKVTHVYKNSPAETAGVLLGDEVLTFNGKPISDMNYLVKTIGKLNIDEFLQFEFQRGDSTFHKAIQIGKRPSLYALQMQESDVMPQPASTANREKMIGPTIDQILLQRRINQLEGEIQSLRKLLQHQPVP